MHFIFNTNLVQLVERLQLKFTLRGPSTVAVTPFVVSREESLSRTVLVEIPTGISVIFLLEFCIVVPNFAGKY